jgi:hypothetical protein
MREPDKLVKNPDFIRHADQTNRQSWAIGFLAEHFFNAGTLFDNACSKDAEATSVLSNLGYEDREITPILKHFKCCLSYVFGQGGEIKQKFTADIINSAAMGRHIPPAPEKNP